VQLFDELAKLEIEWIQLDEPVLVTELEPDWQTAFKKAYDTLANSPIKLLLASYFGSLQDNLNLACDFLLLIALALLAISLMTLACP
jgi:5-methyltetrahydropteroyltriglutamate--homocysteine methyltransferase